MSRLLPRLVGAFCLYASSLYMASCHVVFAFDLQQQIDATPSLQTLHIPAGHYVGNFKISKPITLIGQGEVILDAKYKGSTLSIDASNVRIQGLRFVQYGGYAHQRDSGIVIEGSAEKPLSDIQISHSSFVGPGFGIYGEYSNGLVITDNQFQGDSRLHILDRGDGLHLKNLHAPYIARNRFATMRDGVYLETVSQSLAHDNHFSQLQYGLHYMYNDGDEAYHNHAENVSGGYAVMDSRRIYLHHNISRHSSDFGVLLNLSDDCLIQYNHLSHSRNPQGDVMLMSEGKGIFIYGANNNQLQGNVIQDADTGINVAMGAENNQFWHNQLKRNGSQVKYIGDTVLEWSHQGQGNYWDDYIGWDLNGDGIGENAYQPNDSLDRLFWMYPEARLLMDSPIARLLRWLQTQLTSQPPLGVQDSYPLLEPLAIPSFEPFSATGA